MQCSKFTILTKVTTKKTCNAYICRDLSRNTYKAYMQHSKLTMLTKVKTNAEKLQFLDILCPPPVPPSNIAYIAYMKILFVKCIYLAEKPYI